MVVNMPMVSVIIPTYNRSNMVKRAIQSVLDQTYNNYEIIVVDDGSDDNTSFVINMFETEKLKYIKLPHNKGGAFDRNIGIENAHGKYIAFLDSDDEWLPSKIEKQIRFIENCMPSIGAVYCLNYKKKDVLNKSKSKAYRGNIYCSLLRGWCPSTTSSFLLRSEVFNNSGKFDEKLPSFQDYDLWIRIARHWEFEVVREYLVINHQHRGSRVSRDLEPRIEGLNFFLRKWAKQIEEYVGPQGIDFIRRKYLGIVYSQAAIDNLKEYKNKDALKYFKMLLKIRRVTLKFLIQFIILILGGEKLFIIVENVHRNLKKPPEIKM